MRLRAVALFVFASLITGERARAQAPLSYGFRLEGGVEEDSNPARLETIEGATGAPSSNSSPALRLVCAADLASLLADKHLLSLSGGLAGKRFLRTPAQPEDLFIADGRGALTFALGSNTRLGFSGAYYDVFQRAKFLPDARDFRSVSPAVRFEQGIGSVQLSAGGGWRWFLFKPDRLYDFHGPLLFAGYRQTIATPFGETGADWDWSARASVEFRQFDRGACTDLSSCPPPLPTSLRRDRFSVVQVDVTRTGTALTGAGVAVQSNSSNSYGESLHRFVGYLRTALLLPWQLTWAGRAELVATQYRDAVPVGHNSTTGMFVSIEDEGRSTLRLELTRPVGTYAELGARYTLYTNAPHPGPVHYLRQTALLYLALVLP